MKRSREVKLAASSLLLVGAILGASSPSMKMGFVWMVAKMKMKASLGITASILGNVKLAWIFAEKRWGLNPAKSAKRIG
jgi:hypothetical protein